MSKLQVWRSILGALLILGGSFNVLRGSCSTDQCTSVRYRQAPNKDWCKQYEDVSAVLLRAWTPDSVPILTPGGTTQQRPVETCDGCECTSEIALRKCNVGLNYGTYVSCTWYYCAPNS